VLAECDEQEDRKDEHGERRQRQRANQRSLHRLVMRTRYLQIIHAV
jgi:hypothetical protein